MTDTLLLSVGTGKGHRRVGRPLQPWEVSRVIRQRDTGSCLWRQTKRDFGSACSG